MRHLVLRPRVLDHPHRLFACSVALVVVDTPADELVLVRSQPRAELDPPFRQVVERRHFLRQPHRVVKRQLPDHRAHVDALRRRSDRREEDCRRRDRADVGGLVLDDPVVAVAELVHHAGLADVLVVGRGRRPEALDVVDLDRAPRAEFQRLHLSLLYLKAGMTSCPNNVSDDSTMSCGIRPMWNFPAKWSYPIFSRPSAIWCATDSGLPTSASPLSSQNS